MPQPPDRDAVPGDCRVGLITITCDDLGSIEALESLARPWDHLELIAIVEPDVACHDGVQDFIARHCADYQTLPLDSARLDHALGHAYGMAMLAHHARIQAPADANATAIIGSSPPMRALARQIAKIASDDAPVLITGASGTGKELAARAIHGLSPRREHAFVAVNCVALPPTLIHAELFGYEKGAFTGAHRRQLGHLELASRGTVFLDEIGDLDTELQALLLRFLSEGTVTRIGGREDIPLDTRIIAATNVDLEAAVGAGRFREDLYYRLNVLRIHMPPLRARGDDIEPLALGFLARYAGGQSARIRGFSAAAMRSMLAYHWPGNVRELMNRVRRAVVMSEGRLITAEDLGLPGTAPDSARSLAEARLAAERDALIAALNSAGWQAGKAAESLGVSRATFYRLVGRHGLSVEESSCFAQAELPEPDERGTDPPRARRDN